MICHEMLLNNVLFLVLFPLQIKILQSSKKRNLGILIDLSVLPCHSVQEYIGQISKMLQ